MSREGRDAVGAVICTMEGRERTVAREVACVEAGSHGS